MNGSAVEIENLHYLYPDGTQALRGLSLCVKEGESVAVIGGNGAGKSTLLMHLNGVMEPQQGTVRISGISVEKSTLKAIRKKVGMVFQNPDDQLFMATIWDDVAFGPSNMGLSREEIEQRVEDALKQVGLWDIRNKAPHHLSGGEKRNAAIAGILSVNPDILVLDEPGSGLDPRFRRSLINLLQGFGHTKIIATHDLDMALDVCPRCIILKDGMIAADGNTTDILGDEQLLNDCHLEQPYRLR